MLTMHFDNYDWLMKTVYLLLAAASFTLTSLGLEIDWYYIFLAVGGSLGGSMLLAYFRREKSWFEATYKVAMAAVAGLIVGSVVVRYRSMIDPAYIAAVYAASAMLMLFFARTVVGFAESNAGKITTTIFQRVFSIDLEDPPTSKKPSRARGKRGSMPSVVPSDREVQIVETTITQEKEGN